MLAEIVPELFMKNLRAIIEVYISPDFYQTVSMIKAVASILNFAEVSCGELERLTEKKDSKITLMENIQKGRKRHNEARQTSLSA